MMAEVSSPQSCPDEEALLMFASSEIPPAERAAIESHLDQCGICSELVAHLAKSPLVDSRPASGGTPRSSGGSDTGHDSEGEEEVTILPRRLVRGDTVSRYVVLDELGHGGMGVVYAAYDPDLDRKVAIKLLRPRLVGEPQGRGRLLREAKTLGALSHRNVVTVFDVGTEGEQVFVAMEFISGRTLREWVRDARLDWRTVTRRYSEAGRGLAAAHEQGIVHRDFKPSNVLLAADGRVVVVDFGLARAEQAKRLVRPLIGGGAGTVSIAKPGVVVGTPAYMAPEQAEGTSTAASDQYSFCVSLCEALVHGDCDGETSEIGLDVARAPGPVRAILRQGLSPDPADRFGSMSALLDALQKATRRAVGGWVVGGAAIVGLGASGLLLVPTTDPCASSAEAIESSWGPSRKADVEAAFARTEVAFADASWRSAETELDGWAGRWLEASGTVCKAPESSVREMQQACLSLQHSKFAKLVDLLTAADRSLVAEAPGAVAKLPDVSRCLSPTDIAPLPTEPTARAEVIATLEAVGELAVRTDGRVADGAIERGRELVSEAIRTEHGPAIAVAQFELARACMHLSQMECAEEGFYEAIWSAEAGRDALTAAKSWTQLVWLYAYHNYDVDNARRAGRHAEAALDRFGGDPELEITLGSNLVWMEMRAGETRQADERVRAMLSRPGLTKGDVAMLRNTLSSVLIQEGRFEEALITLHEAEREAVAELGTDHPNLLQTRSNIAWSLRSLGRPAEAEQIYRRSLATARETYGPHHDRVAALSMNLATTLTDSGKVEAARTRFEEAVAGYTAVHGPDHPTVGRARAALAQIEFDAGNFEVALENFNQAIATLLREGEPDDLPLLAPTVNRGMVLSELGRYEEAERDLRLGLQIIETKLGPEHPNLVSVLNALGWIPRQQGKYEEALALHRRAAALARRADPMMLGGSLRSVAECILALGDAEEAVAVLEEALEALASVDGGNPVFEADARGLLAEAWLAAGDRAEAEREGRKALNMYRELGSEDGVELTQKWLDETFGGSPQG